MENSRLARIKAKLKKLKELDLQLTVFGANIHGYKLNPPKTAEELERFENLHAVTLPQEYKDFLIEAGNGGVGPYYGLYTLERGLEEAKNYSTEKDKKIADPLAREFPVSNQDAKKFLDHHQACMEAGEDEDIKYLPVPEPFTGVIFLADYGCGWEYVLVVKGEQFGKIWYMGDYLAPCFDVGNKQWGFLDWYEGWLDKSIDQFSPPVKVVLRTDHTILNYDGWNLKKIPKEALKCKNLKKLVLSRNAITEFPKEVMWFEKLRILDLSMTQVIDIPEEISQLKQLKKLRLNYNYHVRLPDSLDQLKNLESLSLTSCTLLEDLPQSLVELEKLKMLFIGQTKIKKLPEDFEKLVSLEFLAVDIEGLDLEDALQKIKKLPRLHTLTITNQLTYPETFKELKRLKTLTITQNNKLWNEGHHHFSLAEEITLIPQLEKLDLTNNSQINALPEKIDQMSSLKTLMLTGTDIRKFPDSMQKLATLEKIEGTAAPSAESQFGILPEEKEKVKKFFPGAKIWIF